jgi:hypothetical protein
MKCHLIPGQKVTPIKPLGKDGFKVNVPTMGNIYTVRDVRVCLDPYNGAQEVGISLIEIVNEPLVWPWGVAEPYFLHYYFRPITDQKTDITIFTRMLDGVQNEERIDG